MADSSEEEDLELPPEIWRLVCDCLRPPQLGRLARTSRDVRTAVRGSPAFRQLLRYDGVWEDVHERSVLGVAVAGRQHRHGVRGPHPEDPRRRRRKLSRDPRGAYEPRAVRLYHARRAHRLRIARCTLIVWARDGSHLRTLEGHTELRLRVWRHCPTTASPPGPRMGLYESDVNTGRELSEINGHGAVRVPRGAAGR